MRFSLSFVLVPGILTALTFPAIGQTFNFSTGNPDGKIATASRPSSIGKIETESADDFNAATPISITSATFTGLIPLGASLGDIGNIHLEIYRVFPKDSQVPPSGNVPVRTNSPSDVAFQERDASAGDLSFSTTLLSGSFTAQNSVVNGINPSPNQLTFGEGPVTGQEIEFSINLNKPFILPADHYFFVPQVELANGDFLWLSAPKPIVAPGTPLAVDLQSWIRNENLAPDWLRVGTDITNQGPFNAAFSLTGQAVPEPGTAAVMMGMSLSGSVFLLRRRKQK